MLALLWLRTRTASLCFSLWLPCLLCGVLLLTLRRRAWLPCLWVCGWMALARWQRIPWHWLRSNLQDGSLGEDFPLLLILCGALLLMALSLFACRKAVLPWSGRRLAGVWGGFLAAAVVFLAPPVFGVAPVVLAFFAVPVEAAFFTVFPAGSFCSGVSRPLPLSASRLTKELSRSLPPLLPPRREPRREPCC